jgi:hypothetical protein
MSIHLPLDLDSGRMNDTPKYLGYSIDDSRGPKLRNSMRPCCEQIELVFGGCLCSFGDTSIDKVVLGIFAILK